jgi:hypothetical protein
MPKADNFWNLTHFIDLWGMGKSPLGLNAFFVISGPKSNDCPAPD